MYEQGNPQRLARLIQEAIERKTKHEERASKEAARIETLQRQLPSLPDRARNERSDERLP